MKTFLLLLTFTLAALGESPKPLKVMPPSEPDAKPEAKVHARAFAESLRQDMEDGRMVHMAKHTDRALDMVVSRAIKTLRDRGFQEDADTFEGEWSFHYFGFLTRITASDRDIGDHRPLIQWLATFYDRVEFLIGVTACKALHISDIKTFNFCIPVVFKPCTFPMDNVPGSRKDEYRRHFAAGAIYYGLIPVVTYWLIDVPCMFGTAGLATLLCGPAASVGEYLMGKFLAPKLSDRIFNRACGGSDAIMDNGPTAISESIAPNRYASSECSKNYSRLARP